MDGVLLLDKPSGVSSNAALQRVRRLFAAAKAGHTGTLDPLASGLLPVCFGEATKFAQSLLDADKRYRATVRFGVATTTGDAEGEVVDHPDLKANQNVMKLQEELTTTENQISFSRQHYNATVLYYNNTIQTIPSVIIAGPLGFTKREFFDAEPEADQVPKVDLNLNR